MKNFSGIIFVVAAFLVASLTAAALHPPSPLQQLDRVRTRVSDMDTRLTRMIDTWNEFVDKNEGRAGNNYYDQQQPYYGQRFIFK
ncbi:hypothetical protein Ocin01_11396 [Orchesella cincta]|uniref:Uncharacterized protein n=1 Tax=Orchesella cincta TaxID=48709 RepID=A0A1D2MQU3_ORCCI|nr:hypothetical protein Ocin01_11396 [Orchesella cincta]